MLEHGWAYGSKGTALRGKTALFAVSTGGREAAYQVDGYNGYTMGQFLAPLYQTCRLCGEIVHELPLAQSTVSQHLKILKDAGLVRGTVDGSAVCYCLGENALRRAKALVAAL